MPKTVRREESKAEKELRVIIKVLSVPNSNSVVGDFAIHRLAALARHKPGTIPDKVIDAMSTNPELASNLKPIAQVLQGPVIKKVDPEIADAITPMSLSGWPLLSAVRQDELKVRSTRNEKPIRLMRRMEDPRKITERIETGATAEWTGTGWYPDDQ